MISAGAVIAIEKKPTAASRAALASAVSYLEGIGYETTRIGPGETWRTQAAGWPPDIVLIGTGDVASVTGEVKRIHAAAPRAQVLVAVEALTTKSASQGYGAGATVVAPARVFAAAVKNVVPRTGRVEERTLRPYIVTPAANAVRHPLEEAFVEAFHDRETGRLDAARVADAYGVSLSALARGLKITQSALSKRPTAAAAQAALRELEFVWSTLLNILHTDERVRGWLNAKRVDLDGRAPIDLLTGGAAESLANYIRSVVAGEPG
jgi:hypothetical protein